MRSIRMSQPEQPHRIAEVALNLPLEGTFDYLIPQPLRGGGQGIRFLHLNHTNPALLPGSEARRRIEEAGFSVAEEGEVFPLGGPGPGA